MALIDDMVGDFFRQIAKLGEAGTMTEADRNRLSRLGMGEAGTMTEADRNRGVRAQLGRDIFAESQRRMDPQGFEQSLDLIYDPGPVSAQVGTTLDMPWMQKPVRGFRVGANVPDVPFIGGQLGATAGGPFGSGFQEGQLQYTKPLDELDRDLEQLFRARAQARRNDEEKRGVLNQIGNAKAAALGQNRGGRAQPAMLGRNRGGRAQLGRDIFAESQESMDSRGFGQLNLNGAER